MADKSRVLAEARKKGYLLSENNNKVLFYQDYSPELLTQRRTFDSVKKTLASLNVPTLRYGVMYPAKLVVSLEGKRHLFEDAKKAEIYARQLGEVHNKSSDTVVVRTE